MSMPDKPNWYRGPILVRIYNALKALFAFAFFCVSAMFVFTAITTGEAPDFKRRSTEVYSVAAEPGWFAFSLAFWCLAMAFTAYITLGSARRLFRQG